MGLNSQLLCHKLASLVHVVSLFLIRIFSYFCRLQKFGFWSKKNDKDHDHMIFVEAAESEEAHENDDDELHLKFKFPTFDEFSISRSSQKGRDCSSTSVSAFIEVLTTFSETVVVEHRQRENQKEEVVIVGLFDGERNGKIDAHAVPEFADQNYKVNSVVHEVDQDCGDTYESEFYSERSSSDGFLSDGDLGERLDFGSENKELLLLQKKVEEQDLQNNNIAVGGFLDSDDFLSEKDNLKVSSDKLKNGDGDDDDDDDDDDGEKSKSKNKLESLWEHQELIEQLEMELRKVNKATATATGDQYYLPTIIEDYDEFESSPKIINHDHFKMQLWKIDDHDNDKLQQHQEYYCMGDQLHKFYKSYTQMMRKFDILNYQKMYAMGFLQLKEPFQSTSQQKHEQAPMLKSLVSQSLWLFKHKKRGSNPIKKLINELQGDLEAVYVGQMCLSWEFLHWQYEKALDLCNSDPHRVHQYNEVAGEFQQFQVLLQRFTEDEPFQGTRVQSYVKSRCVLRNLLQVPVIREDYCLEDKNTKGKKEREEYVITSEMLVEMVEESIRIFWEFVQSDLNCSITSSSSGCHNKLPELHSHEDLKLLIELQKNLQKKDRKLKDILRSEKCILRKFRKRKEDDSDEALQFFAQIDMKLVSRVYNMSRITRDRLIWCQEKLSKISFVNRKIYVEPAFLLFPC